jgi:hypothetical protein
MSMLATIQSPMFNPPRRPRNSATQSSARQGQLLVYFSSPAPVCRRPGAIDDLHRGRLRRQPKGPWGPSSRTGASALGIHSIRVYAVAPGIIETDMSNSTKIDTGRALAPDLRSLKRNGQPDASRVSSHFSYPTASLISPSKVTVSWISGVVKKL